MKILILAANPRKDLNLDREIRDLRDVIEKSRNRTELEVEVGLAVRVGDLQELLFQHQPQIVHFCGHGSGAEGLVLESEEGGERQIRADALAGLFQFFPDVSCVLLNACYSEEQAEAIVTQIDYVIGMRQTIHDDVAIAFSKGFYRALGYACTIEQSYYFGCNAIQLEISGSFKVPRSAVSEQQERTEVVKAIETSVIPKYLKPILKKNWKKAMLSGDAGFISAETRVAIQVEVGKALEILTEELKPMRLQLDHREMLSQKPTGKFSPMSIAKPFFLQALSLALLRLEAPLSADQQAAAAQIGEAIASHQVVEHDLEKEILVLVDQNPALKQAFDAAYDDLQKQYQSQERAKGLAMTIAPFAPPIALRKPSTGQPWLAKS